MKILILIAISLMGANEFISSLGNCNSIPQRPLNLGGKFSKEFRSAQMCLKNSRVESSDEIHKASSDILSRRVVLQTSIISSLFLANVGATSAASTDSSTVQRIESVQAPSPGVALDMLITMKMAKNLRELSGKVDGEDWGAVSTFLTSPWSSGTARFVRKNQVAAACSLRIESVRTSDVPPSRPIGLVFICSWPRMQVLESLAKALVGAASGPDLESDPAFFSDASPDSQRVALLPPSLPPTLPPSLPPRTQTHRHDLRRGGSHAYGDIHTSTNTHSCWNTRSVSDMSMCFYALCVECEQL